MGVAFQPALSPVACCGTGPPPPLFCGRLVAPPAGDLWPHPGSADVGLTKNRPRPELPLSLLIGALRDPVGGAKTHAQPVPRRSTCGAKTHSRSQPASAPYLRSIFYAHPGVR